MKQTRLAAFSLAAIILIFAIAPDIVLAANGHQEDYPPPLLPTPTLAVPVEAPNDSPAESYPAGGTDFDEEIPVPIGIDGGADSVDGNFAAESSISGENQTASSRGIIFLWLGFVATLLVFLTSVFGSIILFTRRNES